MADSLGWSHAGISTASTLAFLWMGVGGFLWGWLYDRYGARVVVLLGGLLQGLGLVVASQAQSLPVFLADLWHRRRARRRRDLCPVDRRHRQLVHAQSQPRRFPGFGRSGARHDAGGAARALADRHP